MEPNGKDTAVLTAGQALVDNGQFSAAQEGDVPRGWTAWMPVWSPAGCRLEATPQGMAMDAPGKPFAVGGVFQQVHGIEPGQAYLIEARAQLSGIAAPLQSVLVRLGWTGNGRLLHPAGRLVQVQPQWTE